MLHHNMALFILGAIFGGAAAAAPPKHLAGQWSATYIGKQGKLDASVVLNYDISDTGERVRISSNLSEKGKILQVVDFAIRNRQPYALNFSVMSVTPFPPGSLCYPVEWDWQTAFRNYAFGWLNGDMERVGLSSKVGDVPCHVFASSIPKQGEWSACIDAEGIPRSFDNKLSASAIGSSLTEYFDMTEMVLQTVTKGPVKDSAFAATTACSTWPPADCDNKGIVNMNIYRVTDFLEKTPADQNGNDLMGLLYGICEGVPWHSPTAALYNMSMSSSFAQFAMCDYISNTGTHFCKGQPPGDKNVGRVYSGKTCFGSDCGQCDPKPKFAFIGEWYSFPKDGMCSEGAEVGVDGCVWKVNRASVMNTKCILQASDILEKCKDLTNPRTAESTMKELVRNINAALTPGGSCPPVPLAGSIPVALVV